MEVAVNRSKKEGLLLHIGSGNKRLEGWVNIDRKPLPGVDVVADVTEGLNFADVRAVYAEHFLEHLSIDAALGFLQQVHQALAPKGLLRLSTPNLDWVWKTHYKVRAFRKEKRQCALMLNRAFKAWGHQFLWNAELLKEALICSGFGRIKPRRYGQSRHEFFRGIERHETYGDSRRLPHVIIFEAVKGRTRPDRLAIFKALIQEQFLVHLE
jgi:predicted SAM-dependent methyltransferase